MGDAPAQAWKTAWLAFVKNGGAAQCNTKARYEVQCAMTNYTEPWAQDYAKSMIMLRFYPFLQDNPICV
jgi:hypothetical protein